jgi:hypothetical protein
MAESENLQTLINQSSPKRRHRISLLLKAHGILPTNDPSDQLSFDVSLLPDELERHIRAELIPSPLPVNQSEPGKTEAKDEPTPNPVITRETENLLHTKKKVVLVVDDDATNIKEESPNDLNELERKLKQQVSLRSSQLRIRKKIKHLLKKINRCSHTVAGKNYGHLQTTDVDDDTLSIAEQIKTDDDDDDEAYEAAINDDVQSEYTNHKEPDESEIIERDDQDDMLEDDENDESGLDEYGNRDDVLSVVPESEGATDYEASVDEEESGDGAAVHDSNPVVHDVKNGNSDRLGFKSTSSLSRRFILYKDLLQCTKKIDFGDISELGLNDHDDDVTIQPHSY